VLGRSSKSEAHYIWYDDFFHKFHSFLPGFILATLIPGGKASIDAGIKVFSQKQMHPEASEARPGVLLQKCSDRAIDLTKMLADQI
jgi:hypothetical protein